MTHIGVAVRDLSLPSLLPAPEDVDRLPFEALPPFLLELAALQSRAALRLRTAAAPALPTSNAPERHLTVREAADRCGMSADWLYRHKDSLPFTRRLGRSVRFSEGALIRWMATRGR